MPRTLAIVAATASLTLGLAACGSDGKSVSVPTATTPAQTQTQPTPTQTTPTQTTPPTTSTPTTPTQSTPGSGGTPAPQGSSGGTSPGGGGGSGSQSAKQRFEQYCKQNPNTCGE
jgi:uncharacterized membrane protein YgcG